MAGLIVEIVGEKHQHFRGTDRDLSVHQVGSQLDGVPLSPEVGIHIHLPALRVTSVNNAALISQHAAACVQV